MKKIMVFSTLVLTVAFLSAFIVPAFAAAPTVIDDVWFVVPVFISSTTGVPAPSFTADKVWTLTMEQSCTVEAQQ